jgi:uncharacterized protein (TIGR02996 family)
MTEEELLAGIAAHPHEGDRWLVLADWLEDQSDPRAELVRLRWQYHYQPDHADFEVRRQRLVTLQGSALAPVIPTITNSLGMSLALIPPGAFWMGTLESEQGRDADETRHRVTLTEPYYLGVYPVTVAEFERFVTATKYQTEPERGGGADAFISGQWRRDPATTWRNPGFTRKNRDPVVCITWNDARKMVAWINKQEAGSGFVYSLATEAQWEFACRTATDTRYFWGTEEGQLKEYAWFRSNSRTRTHAVNTKKPSPWGLFHMTGNVWEWCQDWYGAIAPGAVEDPTGPRTGEMRVLRGGSWHVTEKYCRAGDRSYDHPGDADSHTGFRLAASVAQGARP